MENESLSLELTPPAPPEPGATPWVDRAVRSPVVRSGYLSLAGHLLLCILLAIFAQEKKTQLRLRPLVFSISQQPVDDAAGDSAAAVDIGAPDAAAGSDKTAQASASAAAGEPPLVDEPPLVAMAAVDTLPAVDPLPEESATEGPPPDQAFAQLLAGGPIAQPVSAR